MGLVPSINSGGFVTFAEHGNATGVFGALLRHYNKAAKTVVSLWVFNCDSSLPNTGVSLALSSSYNYLILALVAVRST